MIPKFPLMVQFVHHPGSKEAEDVAVYLHSILNDDPAVPGLRIPTCFIPDDNTLLSWFSVKWNFPLLKNANVSGDSVPRPLGFLRHKR